MNIREHPGAFLKVRSDRYVGWNILMDNKIAVSIPEAAEICGVGKSTIYRLIERGEIKRKKLGKRALILVCDLQEYMSNLAEE